MASARKSRIVPTPKTAASSHSKHPVSTYRIQLHRKFSLRQATSLVDYLHELGMTDCYTSPFFKARQGSMHGYDIVDYATVNPELGGENALQRFVRKLQKKKMGLLIDIVPNHMCIADPDNQWWNDVLENGPSSRYAKYFDIDWDSPQSSLKNKVLLPVLGAALEEIFWKREIRVVYDKGSFCMQYWESRYPLEPKSWLFILRKMIRLLRAYTNRDESEFAALQGIATDLDCLPGYIDTNPENAAIRQRQIPEIKKRLSSLIQNIHGTERVLEAVLKEMNTAAGRSKSPAVLEDLLSRQPYRLACWRDSAKKINYRRFFEINDLGGMRVEDPEVFSATHQLIFQLIERNWISGLRVDHVDGLLDPEKYLNDLVRACRSIQSSGVSRNLVVEKILCGEESLRNRWSVSGTTGYEFLNLLNGLFVHSPSKTRFTELYSRFTRKKWDFQKVLHESKKEILRESMTSEVNRLARLLGKIAQDHSSLRKFMVADFRKALIEIIAWFPIYRTYISNQNLRASREDKKYIDEAFRKCEGIRSGTKRRLFQFIKSILLEPSQKASSDDRKKKNEDHRLFVMKFQQLTGPVMAKGVEDTALYRFFPLASLNEVGGEPADFGVSSTFFHQKNQERLKIWPHSLLATSTHDTKRSEDVRSRLNVLSEMPEEWGRSIRRWRKLNKVYKSLIGRSWVPDANEEYLIYQTLLGAWPCEPMGNSGFKEFVERIQGYMQKALREAKTHTNWIAPNLSYEEAVAKFIKSTLDRNTSNDFLEDFESFLSKITGPGIYNSLSQTLLKIASPGVPDIYQGCETLNFSLVDPDNRRPVDYGRLKRSLTYLNSSSRKDLTKLSRRLLQRRWDGRVKLFITSRALSYRRAHPDLFAEGDYVPLNSKGQKKDHLVAFSRILRQEAVIVLVGRFFLRLGSEKQLPLGDIWGDTALSLKQQIPPGIYRDVFSGMTWKIDKKTVISNLHLSLVFAHFPVALLGRVL